VSTPPDCAARLVLHAPDAAEYGGRRVTCGAKVWLGLKWVARLAHSGERRGKASSFVRAVWGEGQPSRVALRALVFRVNEALRELGYPGMLLLEGDTLGLG